MTADQVATAVKAWALETVPALENGYDHAVSSKEALPDVVVEVVVQRVVLDDVEFPYTELQQVILVRYDLELSFMVDNTDTQQAASELRGYADSLLMSILQDGTLGGRVPFVSPFVNFDYTPPFVQYADGTEGREMTMALAVADPVEVVQ